MSIIEQIQQAADAKLLDWLTNGKMEVNEITGEEARRDLTAAEMACVIKRLGQGSAGGTGSGLPSAPAENMMASIIARNVTASKLRIAGMSRAESA